jgi:hypothetical protein|tara:strand:- start:428 stop:691 length:264 start_codon:yes stop_codon:yes gene_type:complete
MTEQVEIRNLVDLVAIVLLRLVVLVEVLEHRVGLVVEAAVAALVVYLTQEMEDIKSSLVAVAAVVVPHLMQMGPMDLLEVPLHLHQV